MCAQLAITPLALISNWLPRLRRSNRGNHALGRAIKFASAAAAVVFVKQQRKVSQQTHKLPLNRPRRAEAKPVQTYKTQCSTTWQPRKALTINSRSAPSLNWREESSKHYTVPQPPYAKSVYHTILPTQQPRRQHVLNYLNPKSLKPHNTAKFKPKR